MPLLALKIGIRMDGERVPEVYGRYVQEYNPYIDPSDNCYFLTVTDNIEEARHFNSAAEAATYWQQVSPNVPLRAWDGRPNRPLTVFCMELQQVKSN